MPNVIILMVNFPEDFMTIFTHEPLCLQDAVVNGGNWSLAGHKKKHVCSALPWAFFICERTHECYFMCLDFPLHCVGGRDKQCNAEQGDVKFSSLRNSCFMGLLMLQYLDKKKKFKFII